MTITNRYTNHGIPFKTREEALSKKMAIEAGHADIEYAMKLRGEVSSTTKTVEIIEEKGGFAVLETIVKQD